MNERLRDRPDIPPSTSEEAYEEYDSIQTTNALHRLETDERMDITENSDSAET